MAVVLSYGYLAQNIHTWELPLPSFMQSDRTPNPKDKQSGEILRQGNNQASAIGGPGQPELAGFSLDFAEVNQIVKLLDNQQRDKILSDFEAFQNFLQAEFINKSILAAAHANKIDQNADFQFMAKRGYETILRDIYLKQLIISKIPGDFPPEEQVKAYYDENMDKFRVVERVQVWQVFLPFSPSFGTKVRDEVKKKAESIVRDLRIGELDFATAAEKYSQTQTGKYNSGYLGLIKLSDIKPEIKKPLLALKPGKVSEPVSTEEGVHILMRGSVLPEQVLAYEEVRDRISQLLVKQLQAKLIRSINEQAASAYPIEITEDQKEQWWLKLRTRELEK